MPRARQTASSMGDIPEGEPVGKLGKLKRQIADQADLVDDMGRDLDHTNRNLRQTTEELAYHKNLAGQSKQLEEEQQLSAVEELQYENFVLQLEMSGMHEASQLYDYQTVDEQNHELRGVVSSMQNENVQLSQLIAEDNRAALEREGRTRLFLEREYREQLKGAESRIKDELYAKLDDRTRNIVLEHRRLQDDLFLLKYNIKEFDSRYRQLDDRRKILSIDNSINQEMNDMMVKETVALRKKLAHSEERRLQLEDTVNQLRGQVHLIEHDGGVARPPAQLLSQPPASAAGTRVADHDPNPTGKGDPKGGNNQPISAAQVASLRMELQRMHKHGKSLRDQRDKWRARAFKLEQICGDLQDDLASAIDAAKNIVDQSQTGIWESPIGWQVSNVTTFADFRNAGGNIGKVDRTGEWNKVSSRQKRPASAAPTASRNRPDSAMARARFRGRPKSALSGAIPPSAMSSSSTRPARAALQALDAIGVGSTQHNMSVPRGTTDSTSNSDDGTPSEFCFDDSERRGDGNFRNSDYAAGASTVLPDAESDAIGFVQPPVSSVEESSIIDKTSTLPEEEPSRFSFDGASGSGGHSTKCDRVRPSTARPPSKGTYIAGTMQRPASAVWGGVGSTRQKNSTPDRARSATPSSSNSSVGNTYNVGKPVSAVRTASSMDTQLASAVLRRSQSVTGGYSMAPRRAADARPQSPLVRRGQSARDFVRNSRNTHDSARPKS